MKTFSTSGTGSQQTLSEIETDKIPVYDSVTDAEADLANLSAGQIGATKDTGTELSQPVDAVESGNLHAVTSNAVAKALSYSTTEQATGGKWIDGKPIYRKTLELILSTSGGIIANLSELNIDTVVNMRGVIFNTTSDFIVLNGSYSYGTDNIIFFIRKTDGCLYFYRDVATYTEGAPCNFTVEYTKTTD